MRLVLIGGGGQASDVLGAVEALAASGRTGIEVLGLVADEAPLHRRFKDRSAPYLGNLDRLPALTATHYILAVGWPEVRRSIAERLEGVALAPATIVDPSAFIGVGSDIAPGTVLLDNSHISANTVIGSHAFVGYQAAVGHDSQVGPFTSVMPSAVISGDCHIGAGVLVGTNATIIEGVSVGDGARIGAGAVVITDVPPGSTMVGNPARET